MAEIHIQKKRPAIWPWLLGAAVLALFAWVVLANRGSDDDAFTGRDTTLGDAVAVVPAGPAEGQSAAVDRYAEFTGQEPDFGELNRAHDYTRNGLQHLADALEAVSGPSDTAPRGRIAALREAATRIGRDATGDHAGVVSVVAGQAADAIAMMQQERFPNLQADAQRVRDAASQINGSTPILSQRDQIRQFFQTSAAVVRQMRQAPANTTSPGGE